MPPGRASLTTTPVAALGPAFETVTVKVTFCPMVGLGGAIDLLIDRSADCDPSTRTTSARLPAALWWWRRRAPCEPLAAKLVRFQVTGSEAPFRSCARCLPAKLSPWEAAA